MLQDNAACLHSIKSPIAPESRGYNLTHVNNPGIIVKSSVANALKLFTSTRNRPFTSSESAGGSVDEYANAIAVDSAGNAYVAGVTTSPDFPVINGGNFGTPPPAPPTSGPSLRNSIHRASLSLRTC